MADEDKKEEIEEVKKETIEDVVREAHDEDNKEDKPEEKVEEPVEEEVEEKVEEKEEVDTQEIADKAKEKARSEIKEEVLKALDATQEQVEEAGEQGWKSPWEMRGDARPKDWGEAVEAGADLAKFRNEEEARKATAEVEAVQAQKEKTRVELNNYWDKQLDDLRTAGKLPPIEAKIEEKRKKGLALSKEENNDPGLKAQRELTNTMSRVGEERKAAGLDVIYNLKEIFYEHYEKSEQPAGADAPVSGGTKTPVMPKSEEIDYQKDIKGKTMEDIIRDG